MLYSVRLETEDSTVALVAHVKQRTLKGYSFSHFYIEICNGRETEVWDNEKFITDFYGHLKNDSFDDFQEFMYIDTEDLLYSASYYWKMKEKLLQLFNEAKSVGILKAN